MTAQGSQLSHETFDCFGCSVDGLDRPASRRKVKEGIVIRLELAAARVQLLGMETAVLASPRDRRMSSVLNW